MKRYAVFILLAAIGLATFSSFTPRKPLTADITGVWMTQSQESMIEVAKSGDNYVGKVYWLKFPIDPDTKQPKVDKKNPDEKLRSRPIMMLNILINFTFSREDGTGKGDIYDPKSGNTYNCKATLIDANTLKIRGYIGASWMGLGRTEVWKKIKN